MNKSSRKYATPVILLTGLANVWIAVVNHNLVQMLLPVLLLVFAVYNHFITAKQAIKYAALEKQTQMPRKL
jgi:hypothetical protein